MITHTRPGRTTRALARAMLAVLSAVGAVTTGTILSAAYALWLYRKIIYGTLTKPSLAAISDLSGREILILAPLVVLTIYFGVYPKPILDVSSASVTALLENYHQALSGAKAAALGF